MSEIRKYVLVDANDQELAGEFEHFDDAQREAARSGYAVVAQIYEYSDSELVWTPDGSDIWPPK